MIFLALCGLPTLALLLVVCALAWPLPEEDEG